MRETLRWFWTQITSMRTALVLLFLVALAAIPGSFIPQRPNSPMRVEDFAERHPQLHRLYEPLGMYDVYSSPWFSAIYLLLFVSLVGCIVPRIGVYVRALRTPPPRMPSRLTRLPEWGAARLADRQGQDAALEAAEGWLRAARFRTERSRGEAASEGWQGVSAERGHLREFGNLLFHLSLVGALLGIAWNNLYAYKGDAIVVEGRGFSNVITQYDQFRGGAMVDPDELPPFSVRIKSFIAEFEKGPVQRGAARTFRAEVTKTVDGASTDTKIEVNKPLTIKGNKVHILGHGYAAHVTVKDAKGNVAYQGPVVFLPQDGNFTSSGVIKAPDARPQRLAFEGLFLPTAVVDQRGPHSIFPDAISPELFLNAWSGKPRQETGAPENVYALDKAGLTQMSRDGRPVAIRLKVGQAYDLPTGGSIQFDGWSRWTKLQISRAPGLPLVFGSLATGVVGLCLSLFVRPRRLWVKLFDDGRVEVGGLDRADSRTGLAEDVAAILDTLDLGEFDETDATAAVSGDTPEQVDPTEDAEGDEDQ